MGRGKKILKFLGIVLRGELLLTMRLDKFLPHVIVVFVLVTALIYSRAKIDVTMIELEKSTQELETIRIQHAQKTCEYVGLEKLSTIEGLLKDNDISIGLPEKPAGRIK